MSGLIVSVCECGTRIRARRTIERCARCASGRPPEPTIAAARAAICRGDCEHYLPEEDGCGLERPGRRKIDGPRGTPNPAARCKAGRWGPVDPVINSPVFDLLPQQPPIDGLIAVTSIAPHSDRRIIQQTCIASWLRLGLRVVAAQQPEEIDSLAADFPGVEFTPATRRHSSKRNVLINDLADVFASRGVPGILINSDIQIRTDQATFVENWTPQPGTQRIGTRTNVSADGTAAPERYGLDVFQMTPSMADALPEIEMAIGVPFWDYWLPYHLRTVGYRIEVLTDPIFLHRAHATYWNRHDWEVSLGVFRHQYQIDDAAAEQFRSSRFRDSLR